MSSSSRLIASASSSCSVSSEKSFMLTSRAQACLQRQISIHDPGVSTPLPAQRVRGDQAAQIRSPVPCLRPVQPVAVHRPERRGGLVREAVAEGADNTPLEVYARIRRQDDVAVAVRDLGEPVAEDYDGAALLYPKTSDWSCAVFRCSGRVA